MSLPTISAGDLTNKGVTGMPANPELSVGDLQKKFDELSIDVIVPKFQALVTALENASAGLDLGVTAPTGIVASNKVKSVVDAIATVLLALKDVAETEYDPIVSLLTGITDIVNTVDNLETSIPTCKAIVDFIQIIGGGDMLKATYDTTNNGIVDNSERLGNQLPAYYALAADIEDLQSQIDSLEEDINTLLANEVIYEVVIATSDWVSNSGAFRAVKTLSGLVNGAKPQWGIKIAGNTITSTESSNDNLVSKLVCTTDTATFWASAIPIATITYELRGIKL